MRQATGGDLQARFAEIVGDRRVRSDPSSLAAYGIDATVGYRGYPALAVFPATAAAAASALALAGSLGLAVTARGGGTSLAAGATPLDGSIVICTELIDQPLRVDPEALSVRCGAGVKTAQIDAAAAEFGLFLAPDPGARAISVIGGNVATNAGGALGLAYGVIRHHVLGLEYATASGEIRRAMRGAVIIGGSTGDGKSTTLIRCMEQQYLESNGQISIVTVEDPVEYTLELEGVLQIPVISAGTGAERAAAYRKTLMHFVRINPDVGCISEIRDHDAAREVIQFVDTGHQVWTTLHVNSANGILFRLIDMGVEPGEVTKPGSISLLMKQTLVPLLCSCSRPFDAWVAENAHLGFLSEMAGLRVRNHEGCPKCVGETLGLTGTRAKSGYRRQIAVAECIAPDEEYLQLVRGRDAVGAMQHWLKPRSEGGLGGRTLSQKLWDLVLAGVLDPADAIRKGCDIEEVQAESEGSPSVLAVAAAGGGAS